MYLQTQVKQKSATTIHWLYVANNFIKTPINFIPIILYILYLSSILLIIPKFLATSPLYIWNNSNFNMKIFNLTFISLICGTAASNIFCIRKNDVVQLVVFSKPIKRNSIILNKIVLYFLVMSIYILIIVGIGALIPLIFGWHDHTKNVIGIKPDDYTSLLLSLFVGNCICSLVFIAFGILIGMKRSTTITMVMSLLIASAFNFFNFVFPYMSSKAEDYLQNKYWTSINSYAINTLEQYQNIDASNNDSINVCTLWSNEDNLDPIIVQKETENNSNEQIFGYFDIGNQLSQLFHCFPSENVAKQAKKLSSFGGDSTTYKYSIKKNNVFTNNKTPLFFYDLVSTQGLDIPTISLLGINLNETQQVLEMNNINPNFVSVISKNLSSIYSNNQYVINEIFNKFDHCFLTIHDLKQNFIDNNLMSIMNLFIDKMVEEILLKPSLTANKKDWSYFSWGNFIWTMLSRSQLDSYETNNLIIPQDKIEQFKQLRHVLFNAANGIDNASDTDRLLAIGHFQLGFFVCLMQKQKQILDSFFENEDKTANYPYTSEQIRNFFSKAISTNEIYDINFLLSQLVSKALPLINPQNAKNQDQYYLHMPFYKLSYCESINQLHEYEVKDFFATQTLVIIWAAASALMVTIALCIYWKTDIV